MGIGSPVLPRAYLSHEVVSPEDIEGHSTVFVTLSRRDAAGERQPCLLCAEFKPVKRINPSVEGGGAVLINPCVFLLSL